jgi:3-deoxy-D-manno-octulosonate 8-phosphate phosphatase (KDO 8-P phosphatase)
MKTSLIVDADGVLTDGTVYVDAEGRESLRFCKRDGWLLREAAEAGITVVVCTLDPNPAPSRERAVKMGLEHVAVSSPEGKRDLVLERKQMGRVVYIGDSPQDLLAMEAADEAFTPSDADWTRIGMWMLGSRWFPADYENAKGERGVCRTVASAGGGGVLDDVLRILLREAEDAK